MKKPGVFAICHGSLVLQLAPLWGPPALLRSVPTRFELSFNQERGILLQGNQNQTQHLSWAPGTGSGSFLADKLCGREAWGVASGVLLWGAHCGRPAAAEGHGLVSTSPGWAAGRGWAPSRL